MVYDCLIKDLDMYSCVCATGHIKDPVPLLEKSRASSPGGRFSPSFIYQKSSPGWISYVCSRRGLSLDGFSLDGLSLDGFGLDGLSLDGLSLDGLSLDGLSLDGLSLDGFSLDGLSLDGLSLDGLSLDGLSLDGLSCRQGVRKPLKIL